MGIVSDVYKGFIIGEEGTPGRLRSKDYGVYINGDAVYDSPSRDAEMITIPGRNGAYYKDNGRYNNITVTYRAGMFGDDQTDFAENIRKFRNAIAIRTGYEKIYDDYNTDEYRVGAYKGGLEIDPTHYSDAGQFDVVFDCKPQRFLKSGDTTYTLTSGRSITNPTAFEAQPLLMVKGYGTINLGSFPITIDNVTQGTVQLCNSVNGSGIRSVSSSAYTNGLLNSGDTITMNAGTKVDFAFNVRPVYDTFYAESSSTTASIGYSYHQGTYKSTLRVTVTFPELTFTAGTSSTVTHTTTVYSKHGSEVTTAGTLTVSVAYNASNRTFTTSIGDGLDITGDIQQQSVYGDSSISTLGNPSYIDCEIGEAYKIVNGQNVSINNAVSLGSTLPYLQGGTTTVTYDSTITELKIIPRWWRL